MSVASGRADLAAAEPRVAQCVASVGGFAPAQILESIPEGGRETLSSCQGTRLAARSPSRGSWESETLSSCRGTRLVRRLAPRTIVQDH